jgi:hypothetical protein
MTGVGVLALDDEAAQPRQRERAEAHVVDRELQLFE